MAYYILTEDCICCGSCAAVCSIDAIQEGVGSYEINDVCVECGTCVAVCPCENIQWTSQTGVLRQNPRETRNVMVMPESLPIKNINMIK